MRSLLLPFLLLPLATIAQEIKVIPPAPEATSAFKFAEVPVSHYTGVANTSIELCRIEAKGIAVPVTVAYHGRGVKVDEIASRVGLGWALSYGGMVSRQTRGRADDHAFGLAMHTDYNDMFTDSVKRQDFANDIVNFDIDKEPDLFFLDMNGESAKFTFDPTDGKVLLQKKENIRVTPLYDTTGATDKPGIRGWKVVDKNGNTFYYGYSKDRQVEVYDYDLTLKSILYKEGSDPAITNIGEESPPSSWPLVEIETALGDRIEFSYALEGSQTLRRSYDKVVMPHPEDHGGTETLTSSASLSMSYQNQVSEIRFSGGKVVFTPQDSARKDLAGGRALGKVSVYDGQGTLLKEFAFQYAYTAGGDDGNLIDFYRNTDLSSDYRLFLSSVREAGRDGGTKPPHLFEYSGVVLPNRFSNSQDAWGYYNGKPNGRFLTFFNYMNQMNREVDTVMAGAGLLRKVTYPTGGSAEFFYEHNVADPPPFLGQLLVPRINPTKATPKGYSGMKHASNYQNGVYSYPVTISNNLPGGVTFLMDLPYCPPRTDSTQVPAECGYTVNLVDTNGGGKLLFPHPYGGKFLDIQPGQYTVVVTPPANFNPADSSHFFHWMLDWVEEERVAETAKLYASGKRIKRIVYRNENGAVQTKDYRYGGGKVFGLPGFYFLQTKMVGGIPVQVMDEHGSMPGSPLTSLQGNSVGYAYVTEYFGEEGSNHGKTEYAFTVDMDGGEYYKFPYTLPLDYEWLRGKPLSTKVYEAVAGSPGQYTLRKSVGNSYSYAGNPNATGIFTTPLVHADSTNGLAFTYSKNDSLFYRPYLLPSSLDGGYKVFYLSGGTFDLHKTSEAEFFPGGGSLQRETEYFYDYSRHYQLASTEALDSKGRKTVSRTTYALTKDPAQRSPVEQKLAGRNMAAVPVLSETEVREGPGGLLSSSAQRTAFTDIGGLTPTAGDTVLVPEKVETSIDGGPWLEQHRYDAYDGRGNPLGVTAKASASAAYVWGYGGQYPIAEARNAQAGEVFHTSFEEDGTLGAGAKTGRRYHAGNYTFTPPAGFTPASGSLLSYWRWTAAAGKWEHVELAYGGGQATCTGERVDEVRIHPSSSQMTTYTYDPLVGMSSATDANGRTTYYRYDGFGRLAAVLDAEGNVLKTYEYHYKGQQ